MTISPVASGSDHRESDIFERVKDISVNIAIFATCAYIGKKYRESSIETWFHELGHMAAVYLTFEVEPGKEPIIKLNDRYNSGGSISYWIGNPTPLGKLLGPEGSRIFVSLMGSVPSLALNSLLVGQGVSLTKQDRKAGIALLGLGIGNHLTNLRYPLSACNMDEAAIITNAAKGHDFASIALNGSQLTSLSAHQVAVAVLVGLAAVPILSGVGVYLFDKGSRYEAIPDSLALLELQETGQIHSGLPVYDLIDRIPESKIFGAKKRLLGNIDRHQKESPLHQVARISSIASAVFSLGYSALSIAQFAFGFSVGPALSAIGFAFPLFSAVSLAASFSETAADLQTSRDVLPIIGKLFSLALLVTTAVSTVMLLFGTFIPGTGMLLFYGSVIGVGGSLLFRAGKTWIFKRQMRLRAAVYPMQFNYMLERAERHPHAADVKEWERSIHSAHRRGMISPDQISELKGRGLLAT